MQTIVGFLLLNLKIQFYYKLNIIAFKKIVNNLGKKHMTIKIKILGCGSSVGVPVIACECKVCKEKLEKNIRTRSSIIISWQEKNILVDFGADIKHQLIRENIKNIDAVILTHDHADHVNGIDDLKIFPFRNKKPLELYADPISLKSIQEKFFYMFNSPDKEDYWGNKRLNPNIVNYEETHNIEDVEITFFKQHHDLVDSFGLRIGNFVYSTDIISFPSESEKFLHNIDLWLIDCLEYKATKAHCGLEDILIWQEKFKPKMIYLTNMGHKIDYYKIQKELPNNIMPAYDGLTLEIIKY